MSWSIFWVHINFLCHKKNKIRVTNVQHFNVRFDCHWNCSQVVWTIYVVLHFLSMIYNHQDNLENTSPELGLKREEREHLWKVQVGFFKWTLFQYFATNKKKWGLLHIFHSLYINQPQEYLPEQIYTGFFNILKKVIFAWSMTQWTSLQGNLP